jgi:hypothetical protein
MVLSRQPESVSVAREFRIPTACIRTNPQLVQRRTAQVSPSSLD